MSWSIEFESKVPAPRFFKAVVLDWHNLAPKIAPSKVTGGEIIQGDGGPGTVRKINFASGMPFSFVKERLDFIDNENFEIKQTLVEGGDLGKSVESAASHFKFTPKSGGGCVCKVAVTYRPIPGVHKPEEDAKAKEELLAILKATEAHLDANPTAYAN